MTKTNSHVSQAHLEINNVRLKYPRSQSRPAISPGRKTRAYYVYVCQLDVMEEIEKPPYLNGPNPCTDARVSDRRPQPRGANFLHSHRRSRGFWYEDSFVVRLKHLLGD